MVQGESLMGTSDISIKTQHNYSESKKSSKNELLICALFGILLFARAMSNIAFYAFIGVSLIVFLVSDIRQSIIFLFFLLPFATILKQDVDGMSFYTVLFFFVVLKMIMKHRTIDVRLVVAILLFFLYGLFFSGEAQLTTIITMLVGVLMLYCIKQEDINADISSTVIAYSIGICLASVLALFKQSFPIINEFVTDSMIKLGAEEYAERFAGLHGNPNYFTLDVTVALSALIVLSYYNNKKPKTYILCLIALSVFGLMSVSKSFLLVWIFLILCWFVLSIKQGAGKLFKFISVVIIGAMIIYLFTYDYVNTYLFRFVEEGTGTFDDLTTGRTVIWDKYIKAIFNDIKILLLGNGLNTILTTIDKGTHSTYLSSLFGLGIIGTAILVYMLCICIGNLRFKGCVFITLIVLLIRMIAIDILTYDSTWFYLSVLLLLARDYRERKRKIR